jgi:hypothetical protein
MTVKGIFDRIWNGRGLLTTHESSDRGKQLEPSIGVAETRTGHIMDTKHREYTVPILTAGHSELVLEPLHF